MTPELQALARRAVACPRWRWMPGMAFLWCGDLHRVADREPGTLRTDGSLLPDLTDPATLGCLLALVREAWGDPGFYAAQSSAKIKGTGIFGWDTFGYLHGKSHKGMLYRSEAEALVAALETGGGCA